MAVVQISRIQVRRGQKQQGSGLPQLASGELGWAVDTRELYIGNGSVAEGAPAVGNTKILTEYDDLFQLANTYTYKATESYLLTGPNSTNPIRRTLQSRLDDRVSVRSFGAKGDGTQIDTAFMQRAIHQLDLNDATKGNPQSRVVIHMEAGVYLIDDTIFLPPYTTISGAGPDKTIIRQTATGKPIFKTVNLSSVPGAPASDASTTTLNQPVKLCLDNLTLEQNSATNALVLENCADSSFAKIKIAGPWASGSAVGSDAGIMINSLSGTVESNGNKFENCEVTGFSYAVYSDWDINNNNWDSCKFNSCAYGVVFGENTLVGSPGTGQSTGPSFNEIRSCVFDNINRQGIWIVNGEYNLSQNNNFTSVGNDGGIEKAPKYPVIQYLKATNKSIDDYFSRTKELISGSGLINVPYIPEVEGTAFYDLKYENTITFGRLSDTRLFRLPGITNQSYEVEYIMVSNNYRLIRNGVLTVVVDGYSSPAIAEISDDYHFIGDETYADAVSFEPLTRTFNVSVGNQTLTYGAIDVKVTSTMPVDDQTEIKFIVKAKKSDVI